MIFGVVLLVVGLIWLWLIHVDRVTIQLRGAAVMCAAFGLLTIVFEVVG